QNDLTTYSFKKLKQGKFLTHLRITGLENSWRLQGSSGIINSELLIELQNNYRFSPFHNIL
ncbi:MAG: hypothetical protein KDC52_15835, partial [Ignavibacteriae bacterium]|nr:hypothetical protein [Ignavibacteriota bacterium]